MKRVVFYGSFLFVFIFGGINISGQCVPIAAGPTVPALPVGVTHSQFLLPHDTAFKIVSAGAMTTSYDRTNDYMVFEVAQNVYFDSSYVSGGVTQTVRCVAIAKGTKVFGKVDYAHKRTILNLAGKARIMVYVDSLQTDTGETVDIAFKELPAVYKSRHDIARPCKNDTSKQCITGRRARGDAVPGIANPLIKGYEEHLDDDATKQSIAVAAAGSLFSISGLSSFVSRPEALLKAGQVYDVVVKNDKTFWIKLPDPTK